MRIPDIFVYVWAQTQRSSSVTHQGHYKIVLNVKIKTTQQRKHKNLGPAIIERHDYLKIAMRDHLSDTTTYKSLTTSEIDRYSSEIKKHILGWLKKYNKKLTKMERAFLRKELKSNQPHMLDSSSP